MWLELRDGAQPTGLIQGRTGHALPTGEPAVQAAEVTFDLPAEWESTGLRRFEAETRGDSLIGAILREDGSTIPFTAVRAPTLVRMESPVWGDEIDLLAGGLDDWHARVPDRNGWRIENGELINGPPSSDLITDLEFTDFTLHIEANVPEGGNSGIYLRGRHEVQIEDNGEAEPTPLTIGAVYGFLEPSELPGTRASEWNTCEILLVGRRVTVVLNGRTLIADRPIPGITGGALDSDEGAPGPIMLQGDHGPIEYRDIVITAATAR
jgi:hypothetical protein